MRLVAVTCEACGGAVAMEAGRAEPACLFCGQARLRAAVLPEGVEPPAEYLPFRLSAAQAREAFRRLASSSVWYPGDLRRAPLALRPVFVAAWTWDAEVESHWAAMVPASTRSGVHPVAGTQVTPESVLVPASALLTRGELASLGEFRLDDARPFDAADPPGEHEIGTLTRSAAAAAAREALTRRIESRLTRETGARKLHAAHVVRRASGRPVLVPAYIATCRWRDRLIRFVVHGQDGRVTGKPPVSVGRVLAAVGLVAALVAAAVAWAVTR